MSAHHTTGQWASRQMYQLPLDMTGALNFQEQCKSLSLFVRLWPFMDRQRGHSTKYFLDTFFVAGCTYYLCF